MPDSRPVVNESANDSHFGIGYFDSRPQSMMVKAAPR